MRSTTKENKISCAHRHTDGMKKKEKEREKREIVERGI